MVDWLRRLFGPRRALRDDVAMVMVDGERRREISVRELAVGTKLAGDALLQLLVEKGLVNADEMRDRIRRITEEHYRAGDAAPGAGADTPRSESPAEREPRS